MDTKICYKYDIRCPHILKQFIFQIMQRNLWLNLKKIIKDYYVYHNLPLFLNMSIFFFFSFPPLLCVLEFQNRIWQRKCDSDVLFFVLKLLSLADCVFLGCELQDVVLGSSLPADPTSVILGNLIQS